MYSKPSIITKYEYTRKLGMQRITRSAEYIKSSIIFQFEYTRKPGMQRITRSAEYVRRAPY